MQLLNLKKSFINGLYYKCFKNKSFKGSCKKKLVFFIFEVFSRKKPTGEYLNLSIKIFVHYLKLKDFFIIKHLLYLNYVLNQTNQNMNL